MSDKYILDGKEIKQVGLLEWVSWLIDLLEWASWLETDREARRVGKDTVGDVEISTAFLGLDHQWGDGPPLLFETMTFGGAWDEYQWRYSTWEEAETGHNKIVQLVRENKGPDDYA